MFELKPILTFNFVLLFDIFSLNIYVTLELIQILKTTEDQKIAERDCQEKTVILSIKTGFESNERGFRHF